MALLTLVLLIFTVALQEASSLPPQIIHQRDQRQNDGGYRFEYETEDGSKRQEIGTFVVKENDSEPVLHVKGMYSYFDNEGREFVIHYEADDKGTRSSGDFVPLRKKVINVNRVNYFLN